MKISSALFSSYICIINSFFKIFLKSIRVYNDLLSIHIQYLSPFPPPILGHRGLCISHPTIQVRWLHPFKPTYTCRVVMTLPFIYKCTIVMILPLTHTNTGGIFMVKHKFNVTFILKTGSTCTYVLSQSKDYVITIEFMLLKLCFCK